MIADLKTYPAMKDSCVPWLGEVPEHWKQLPGRACYRELSKDVSKASIAKILDVSSSALYHFIETRKIDPP